MRNFFKKSFLLLLVLLITSQFWMGIWNAAYSDTQNSYTVFRSVDKNTFNEYRYLITKEFFSIQSVWEVDEHLDSASLSKLKDLVNRGFNYLPDNNLDNENTLNNLNIAIAKAFKYNSSNAAYIGLIKSLSAYLDESSIDGVIWEVKAFPREWNAPFNVTLRTDVVDPTWTIIPKYNYVWWIELWTRKIYIGSGPSINYTFKEEWNFTVFVSVISAHKNSKWYTDVISFQDKVEIKVKEKIASLIVKVNGNRLWTREVLKFTPSQAKYGLLFDATSSIPTGSARFTRTEWDFGNSEKREYSSEPKIERVVYSKEWDYDIKLLLKPNLGKIIEKHFVVSIHDPIATINVTPKEWFLWDKFTISANNLTSDDNLTYNWTIVDIIEDEVILSKQTKLFTYNFPDKWHFNIKLEVDWIDSGNKNIDTKNIYINSRAPVANFKTSIPEKNKPNRILIDATDSFDPDFTDTGKLKYSWEIDGKRIVLDQANDFGSLGYYTFDTIWDHTVILEVEDPDNIIWTKNSKVNVNSILSVDFSSNPRAIKRWESIKFEAISPNARFFEWDYGDLGKSTGWIEESITHKYEKTGIFNVKLKVTDEYWKTNTQTKVIYVWDWISPVAILNVWNSTNSVFLEKGICGWEDAYMVDRLNSVSFDAWDSIDITWTKIWLNYSLKIWNNKYYSTKNTLHKFDELGCFPVILKVISTKNNAEDTKKIWVKVENIEPGLSSLTTKVESLETDPVIVTVNAVWARDKDWIITSYLWYYYTDLDDEPQDFRSTVGASTRFVLPKITWNYYFVVLLTDDSGARISSKELWKKSSLTLAWNNMNVPIVELRTPDNSVHVNDEVIFNAKVQNILKQDLSKKVQYFWDFDWDWFYDLETKTSSTTYSYDKPWKFYAKLKVKYKGFSNTRNIEINVANSLIPKIDYISIWNKFVFINNTTWSYENILFDLWDGTKVENKDYFIHSYNDGKSSHNIRINASDWNTIKKEEIKVVKDIQNLLKFKKSTSWVLFSTIKADENNEILITERWNNLIIYFSWKNDEDSYEVSADTNLEKDTDMNWWKDDDIDMSSSEYRYLNIDLNKNKNQLIRVFVKDSDWVVIVSKDYKIIKEYIKEEEIDLWNIVFEWVTNIQKQQLEELKNLVSWIVGDDRTIAKSYVARLKDEWGDENERIKIIYEFDWFLNDSNIQNKDEIIEKIQELLLKWNDENNEKNVAFRALQWLTPWNIICEFNIEEYKTCKEYIDSTLQAIRNNDNLEQNKLLWGVLLDIIWIDNNLTTSQKLDYKATLQSLIYWSVENIPKEIVDEIIVDNNGSSTISSILSTIWYILLVIMILFGLWFAWYYVYYKILNKNSDQNFEDFIADKTDINIDKKEDEKSDIKDDIFSETKTVIKKTEDKKQEIKKEEKIDVKKEEVKSEDVPDWLKWSFDTDIKKEEIKKEDKTSSQPSPLKEKQQEPKKKDKEVKEKKVEKVNEIKKEEVVKEAKQDKVKPEIKKEETLDEIIKVEDDNIPDWLKGSLDEIPKKDNPKSVYPNKLDGDTDLLKKKEVVKKTSTNDNIPDWLKGSLDEGSKKQESKKEETKEKETKKEDKVEEEIKEVKKEENNVEKKKDTLKKEDKKVIKEESKKNPVKKDTKSEEKKTEEKKQAVKKTPEKVEKKDEDKKEIFTKKIDNKKTDIKKEEIKEDFPKKEDKKVTVKKEKIVNKKDSSKKEAGSDLWDDWMDIPDWLKS